MTRSDVRRTFAALCLATALPFGIAMAAPVVDANNPVDLYGADGLPFTPDDVLVARGGYTNTAIFATAVGERSGGTSATAPEKDVFAVHLGSWNPNDTGPYGNTVVLHSLFRNDSDMDPLASGTSVGWRPAPSPISNDPNDLLRLYEPDMFGLVEFGIETPRQVSDDFGGGDFTARDWWKDGNIRVSYLSLANWEWGVAGSAANNPALVISAKHFPKIKDLIKDIIVEKTRCRVGCISVLHVPTGESGVIAHGFLLVQGLKVELDGSIAGLSVQGTVTNSSPGFTVGFMGIDVNVRITGGTESPPDGLMDALGSLVSSLNPFSSTPPFELKIGTQWIIDELRKELSPPLPPLRPEDRQRIEQAWSYTLGIDCLANEVCRALMRTGEWLPWIPTSDAGAMVRDSDDIDLGDTKLDESQTRTAEDVLSAEPEDVTNRGMDYLLSDTLLYGRSWQTDKLHNRLVEWFASNWLCLNMTVLRPYRATDGTDQGAAAHWSYYDLICDKNLTGTEVGGAIEMPGGWPPPGPWYGGQGFLVGFQAALSHDDLSQGAESPGLSDLAVPGNPQRVMAAIAAVTPFAFQDGNVWQATYNAMGVTLGGVGAADLLEFKNDPAAGNWAVDWPPPNDDPASPMKFFHACVANGHDSQIASGDFRVIWDFKGNGTFENAYGNVGLMPNGSDFGRLMVFDEGTGRTGVHHIDIFYVPHSN